MLNIENKSPNNIGFFKFFIPSLFGIIFFMIPIKVNGDLIIPVALLSKMLHNYLSNYLPLIMTILICASLGFTLIAKILKPKFITENNFLTSLFNVSPVWFVARILGAIFAICVFFKVGPEFIWSENTGALLLYDLLPVLFSVFLFAVL